MVFYFLDWAMLGYTENMIESSEDINQEVLEKPTNPEEVLLEVSLRPTNLKDYVGQETIKNTLGITLQAAKARGEQLEHLLFYGPPGLGKTTLAMIIAKEMGQNLKTTSGPAIERAGDLASVLSSLEEGEMLFIDEIHRLPKTVEEILYPAMEDRVLDIMLGKGQGARSIRMDLPHFTIIGATTQAGSLSSPLRDRFGATFRLEYYEPEDLRRIINRSGKILGAEIEDSASLELAKRSRLTPRIANRLLKRVRDFAQVKGHDKIGSGIVREALEMLEIDDLGLDKNDRRILLAIIQKFKGGPVGLSTLAAATGEEINTIADVYEPFLMRTGLLARTPKGRVVTESAYTHLENCKHLG